MAIYRGTLFFQFLGQPPCGFSESWVFEREAPQLAIQALSNLVTERVKILSDTWIIVNTRLSALHPDSNPPVPPATHATCVWRQRNVQLLGCPAQGLSGDLGASDTPWTRLLVQIMVEPPMAVPPVFAPIEQAKQWQVGGIPDTWWSDATLDVPKDAKVRIDTFLAYCRDQLKIVRAKRYWFLDSCNTQVDRYHSWCIKRISNRRIGRPFGLLRGRRSRLCPVQTPN